MATNTQSENSAAAPDFLSDCRLMLRFARKNGTDLTPELAQEIARLDSIVAAQNLLPISDIPPALVLASDTSTGKEPPSLSAEELILKVHEGLSRIVAPATALSLHTTEPPSGKRGLLGGMPVVVRWAAVIALISAVGFVISAGVIAKKAGDTAGAKAKSKASDNRALEKANPGADQKSTASTAEATEGARKP